MKSDALTSLYDVLSNTVLHLIFGVNGIVPHTPKFECHAVLTRLWTHHTVTYYVCQISADERCPHRPFSHWSVMSLT